MYGGGFATIPAYLRDIFGTLQVGAIHGRLLTAWSVAGVAGPSIVTYIREAQINRGVAKADAYSMAIYIMVGVLAIGFVCNLLARPVHERHHHKPAAPQAAAVSATHHDAGHARHVALHTPPARVAISWALVSIPLVWGVYQTLLKSLALFA
jgi:sorbitol-specific phosphotransferase system component IIC